MHIYTREHPWAKLLSGLGVLKPPQFFKFSLDSKWSSVDASQASAISPPSFFNKPPQIFKANFAHAST